MRALPGVQAAGITSNIPLGGNYSDSVILAEGYAMAPGESLISPFNSSVSPGYFEAMSIPLKRGRLFTASDDERAPKVLIIDERLAQRFWKGQDPVGRRMWKPDVAGRLHEGPRPEDPLLHRRRRRRQRPDDGADREGAGRRRITSRSRRTSAAA